MNKKLIIITALLIGAVIGGVFVMYSRKGTTLSIEKTEQLKKELFQRDADKDGLPDWQEEVLGTDKNNPDTDGDGYLDGEEAASGYNPLVKAPNDKLGDFAMSPRPKPGEMELSDPNNLTENLAGIVGNTITAMRPNIKSPTDALNAFLAAQKKSDSESQINDLVSGYIREFQVPEIQDSEIKILDGETTRANIKEYAGKAFGAIIETIPNIDEVIANAIETGNFSLFDQEIANKRKTYQNLKQISVPRDLAEVHKKQINIYMRIEKTYEAIKNIDQDPLKAVIAVKHLTVLTEETYNLANKIISTVQKY